jgi:2-polyprenyl-3-methyl-5-hydroxy-6-metoxy-1,4-benzoquinol methylase
VQHYLTKPPFYFDNVRREIEPLLPAVSDRVLDVGCGAGATLQWLRQTGRCQVAVGIEMMESAAAVARERVDQVVVGDANILVESAFAAQSFDLILCLDVLEHLIDPWSFLAKVQRLLKHGGLIVASVPNVRHLRVVLPLLLAGRWRYEASGILDRTHLRFFTRDSALELMSGSGLHVSQWCRRMPPALSKAGLLNLATLGLARDLVAMGYLVAARKD